MSQYIYKDLCEINKKYSEMYSEIKNCENCKKLGIITHIISLSPIKNWEKLSQKEKFQISNFLKSFEYMCKKHKDLFKEYSEICEKEFNLIENNI